MNKLTLIGFLLMVVNHLTAQVNTELTGIVRKNYFSTVFDPLDSTITYQQFDSATVRLGNANMLTGLVTNAGNFAYNGAINLTGAALNPYENTYIFIGESDMITFSLVSGNIINQVPLSNPIAPSYFDNFRFNNADSTMYGLARRNYYDTLTMTSYGEMFLSKANTNTGLITEISPASIGQGFALAGSAIDPYQMVYYFSSGSNLIGLDIYNGTIYSNAPIALPSDAYFDNFTYSCADSAIYGLVRQNYISYIPIPFSPGDSMAVLDSATVRLGKIDPNNGVVTIISPSAITMGGYSLNASSAIDPNTMTFFYGTGSDLIGVSLITGLLVSNNVLNFIDGEYFDLMRNFDNCRTASAIRTDPGLSGIPSVESASEIQIYPNPATTFINFDSKKSIHTIQILSLSGKVVAKFENVSRNSGVEISTLAPGMYFVKMENNDDSIVVKKIVKQ
jgi:hypothetical protein